jgi:hypothetical protein
VVVLAGEFLEGEDEPGFPELFDAVDDELHAEGGLPGARSAFHDGGAAFHHAAADHPVQSLDTEWSPFQHDTPGCSWLF